MIKRRIFISFGHSDTDKVNGFLICREIDEHRPSTKEFFISKASEQVEGRRGCSAGTVILLGTIS